MKSLLLTGSTGFLGRYIYQYLKKDVLVSTLSRKIADYEVHLNLMVPHFNQKFDIVVHSAGLAHVFLNVNSKENQFHNVNVIGTQNLLKGLNKTGIPKCFVFISSVSVYGIEFGNKIAENHSLLALDPYGFSKIEAEKIVLEWCKKHNVICTILRLPLVVGSNPPGNLGSMIRAIQNGYYFNIASGNARKSMVLASDVAKYILKAAETGGIFNLTDGYHPSFYELSHYITMQKNKKYVPNMPMFFAKKLALIGDKLGHKFPLNSNKLLKITSTLTFDDSKARYAFGWNPTPVLEGFIINE